MIENRDTFFARICLVLGAILFSPREEACIELAYDLAKEAHRWQTRNDGTRYFEHLRRTALLLLDRLRIYCAASVIAALLHDGYEDSPKHVTPLKVEILGGPEAARMLRLLSKVPKEGYAERLMLFGDWKTLAIKLCDRYDNFTDMKAATPEFLKKQTIETRDVYMPIFWHLVTIAPEPYRSRIEKMVEELADLVAEREIACGLAPPAP